MIDIIKDTLMDSIKLIPFLFFAFLIIELVEHNFNNKSVTMISKTKKLAPLFGGILGVFPQCGFSLLATNLYITRIISVGTLVAIYLSTSDEMLPLMLLEKVNIMVIIKILLIKIAIGILVGFAIDFILRNKKNKQENYELCVDEHCDCNHHLIKSVFKHTINITIFIMVITFVLNFLFYYIGLDNIKNILTSNKILGVFISGLIGLIPNCAASLTLTTLYINGILPLSNLMSGLLAGSGVALLILFKYNKNLKENIYILSIIYGVGVVSGIIIELLGVVL